MYVYTQETWNMKTCINKHDTLNKSIEQSKPIKMKIVSQTEQLFIIM